MALFTGIGALIGAISALFYTISALFVKKMAGSVDVVMVYFLRMCTTTLCSVIVVCVKRTVFWRHNISDYIFMKVMAIGTLLQVVPLYYSFGVLPLGDVICVASSSPIFIVIARFAIYKRIPTILEIIMMILTLVGVILCVQPSFIFTHSHDGNSEQANSFINYLPALLSAIGCAIIYLSFDKVSKDVEVNTTMSIFGLVSACISGVYLLATDQFKIPLDSNNILYLCLACVTSHSAVVIALIAVRVENSLMASIGRSSDIVVGFMFDILVFHLVPNILTITGAAIILSALTLPAIMFAFKMSIGNKNNSN